MSKQLELLLSGRREFTNFFKSYKQSVVSAELLRAFITKRIEKCSEDVEIVSGAKEVKELFSKLEDFSKNFLGLQRVNLHRLVPDKTFESKLSKSRGYIYWEIFPECWQLEKKRNELKELRLKVQKEENTINHEMLVQIEEHLDKSNFAAALPLLTNCVEKDVPDFTVYVSLGSIHILSGDLEKAQDCFKKAMEITEKRSFGYYSGIILSLMAQVEYLGGKAAQAYLKASKAESTSSEVPEIGYQQALYCFALEEPEKAEEHLTEVIEKQNSFYAIRAYYDPQFSDYKDAVLKILKEQTKREFAALTKSYEESKAAFRTSANVMGLRLFPKDKKMLESALFNMQPVEGSGILDCLQQRRFFESFREEFFKIAEASMEKIIEETAEKHTREGEIIDKKVKELDRKNMINNTSLIFMLVFPPVSWSILLSVTSMANSVIITVLCTLLLLGIFIFRLMKLKKQKANTIKLKSEVMNLHLKINNIIGNILKELINRKHVTEPFSYEEIMQKAKSQGFRVINEERWYSEAVK